MLVGHFKLLRSAHIPLAQTNATGRYIVDSTVSENLFLLESRWTLAFFEKALSLSSLDQVTCTL